LETKSKEVSLKVHRIRLDRPESGKVGHWKQRPRMHKKISLVRELNLGNLIVFIYLRRFCDFLIFSFVFFIKIYVLPAVSQNITALRAISKPKTQKKPFPPYQFQAYLCKRLTGKNV
jgi:hypothetical protein